MRALLFAVGSFFAPGLGASAVGRIGALIAWVLAIALVHLACAFSIWVIPLVVAVRFAAMIEGFRVVRAAGVRTSWPGVLLGVVANLALFYVSRTAVFEGTHLVSPVMTPTLVVGDHVIVDKLSPRWRPLGHGDVVAFDAPCNPGRVFIQRVIAVGGETVEQRCDVVYVNGVPLRSELVSPECQFDAIDDDDRGDGAPAWRTVQCSEYRETSDAGSYRVHHDVDRPKREAQHLPASGPAQVHNFPVERNAPSCAALDAATPRSDRGSGLIVETSAGAGPCETQLHYVVPPDHVFVMGDNRAISVDSRAWGALPISGVLGRVIGIWFTKARSGTGIERFGDL